MTTRSDIRKVFAAIICATIFISSCQHKQADPSVAIANNIDSEMISLANINIDRLKISQEYVGELFDSRYSELIKEYENSSDRVSKTSALDKLITEEKFTSADKPGPRETKTTGYPGIIRYLTEDNFDLSLKSNDAFVAQVKFMNTKFKTLSQSAVDAIGFYERLTPEQKATYFDMSASTAKPKAGMPPPPDYQKYIRRELERGYNHYQYHLQALFYYYYKQKSLKLLRGFEGNEGGIPNAGKTGKASQSDKQFDIAISGL